MKKAFNVIISLFLLVLAGCGSVAEEGVESNLEVHFVDVGQAFRPVHRRARQYRLRGSVRKIPDSFLSRRCRAFGYWKHRPSLRTLPHKGGVDQGGLHKASR